ncbi:autophagy-related 7 [Lycorma delicatula]|uniref:autophagy-related 7 n=1 Tax=Lycorma delicatula TaxID=130591 RepID=UPI003F5111BC
MATEASRENLLKCTPFCSFIHYTFWPKLSELKLNIDKLEEHGRKIWGYYTDSNKLPSLEVEFSSFNTDEFRPTGARVYPAVGHCLNKNTVESFKECDKTMLINEYGQSLKEKLASKEVVDDPSHLATFLMLTFANLKTCHFYYWFAFLTPADLEIQVISSPQSLEKVLSKELITELSEGQMKLPVSQRGFFSVTLVNNQLRIYSLKEFVDSFSSSEFSSDCVYYFVYADPSPLIQHPGWPIRNLLLFIQQHLPSFSARAVPVIRLRGGGGTSSVITVKLVNYSSLEKWIGWERNERGKYGPMSADLSAMMDPVKLAEKGVELHLKLMKWRLAPQLDLDVIKESRCLLLGAGTLGCSIARNLLAWGVHNITLVDNGQVSHSNPVRQSLYTFEDCKNVQKKAMVAAEALKRIHPTVNAVGVVMDIPMPGHITSDKGTSSVLSDDQLESDYIAELIQKHDVIFLLTDSRESRWLPTMLAASMKKLAITAALGFDTYLVMRHGIHDYTVLKPLGCYFCNDITAPGNSLRDRTLDQQCTVTRPGVANIAASLAVELFVSLLQHPSRGMATTKDETILGEIPHSIRGFLSSYTQMLPATPAFDSCIACSSKVISEYKDLGKEFLKKVYESTTYLEEVTGITALLMAKEIEDVMVLESDEDIDSS